MNATANKVIDASDKETHKLILEGKLSGVWVTARLIILINELQLITSSSVWLERDSIAKTSQTQIKHGKLTPTPTIMNEIFPRVVHVTPVTSGLTISICSSGD